MQKADGFELLQEFGSFDLESAAPSSICNWMNRFCQSGSLKVILRDALLSISNNGKPAYGKLYSEKYEIASSSDFSLSIRISPTGPFLGGLPATSDCMRIVHALGQVDDLSLTIYRLPPNVKLDLFDKDISVIESYHQTDFSGAFEIKEGDIPIFSKGGPVVLLIAESKNKLPLQWTFTNDLSPLHIRAANSSVYRNMTVIELLEQFRGSHISTNAVSSALESMTHHPLHFVRWRATQGLAKIDISSARGVISRLLQDPHPHVSAAASYALSKLTSTRGA